MKKIIPLAAILVSSAFLILTLVILSGSVKEIKLLRKKPKAASVSKAIPSIRESDAVLKVVTKPAGAKVFINGYYKGKSPQRIIIGTVSKTPRAYSIKVLKEGYIPGEKRVKLVAGDRKRFKIIMKSKK